MLSAIVTAPETIEIREVPTPVPAPNQLLVRIESCGVCASNIPPWEGRPWFQYPMEPGALGHEATGFIAAIGKDVRGWELGQRAAFLSSHAYAEFDVAEAAAFVALPKTLDGKPFLGEPLGCAMNIFKRSQIEPGMTVAIIGLGFLGSLLLQLASGAGAKVIVAARKPESLELALSMGAAHAVSLSSTAISEISALTFGRFCDVVIEAAGKQESLDLAAEITKERGRLVIAGYHQDGPRQINMQLWNWRGLDVINAHEREQAIYIDGIRQAVDAVAAGRLTPLLTHSLPLARLNEALQLTRTRPQGFMKAVILP